MTSRCLAWSMRAARMISPGRRAELAELTAQLADGDVVEAMREVLDGQDRGLVIGAMLFGPAVLHGCAANGFAIGPLGCHPSFGHREHPPEKGVACTIEVARSLFVHVAVGIERTAHRTVPIAGPLHRQA